jgi:S-adenosylmethionine synthetase
MKHYISWESVTCGHPDKMADQISDAILDEALKQDKNSHIACETMLTAKKVIIAWEIKTNAKINFEQIARKIISEKVWYDSDKKFYNWRTIPIEILVVQQSPDIALWVDTWGAWDQWIMFWYASNETDQYLPAPIYYAHKLAKKLEEVRKNHIIDYLYPDGKTQVWIEYENWKIKRIDSVVVSSQHKKWINQEQIKKDIIEKVINPILWNLIDKNTKIFINPTWAFNIWWPAADTGLTGRKIIVDTYGGIWRHGWWAFSWKDPTKVDRSAAYMARYLAKHIVASNLADKAEIQLSYAIWVKQPLSIYLDCFGTEKVEVEKIIKLIRANFDLSPNGIIEKLDLKNVKYLPTATYWHFTDNNYNWEKLTDIDIFKSLN